MAELQGIMEDNDFTIHLETLDSVGNQLSRSEIESILTAGGVTLPLTRDVSFIVSTGDTKYFSITYLESIDKYAYEKLTGV